jgi:hypothetical protein
LLSAIAQQLAEHGGVVVVPIAGGVDDHQRTLLGTDAQLVDLIGTVGELGAVASTKLVKVLRHMVEPPAQPVAGSQLTYPLV